MLDRELLEKIIRAALSSGGDYADVFVEWKKPAFVQLEDGKVEKCLSGVEQGAGIRLISGGRTAYAFGNELAERALIEAAKSLGRMLGKEGAFVGADLETARPKPPSWVKAHPEAVPMEAKVSLVRGADRAARALSANVRQVSVIYKEIVQRVLIANSEGSVAKDERVHTLGIVKVVASKGDVIQTGSETLGGTVGFELFEGEALEVAAVKAASRAVAMLSARRAPGGRMPVVISAEAGGTMIHEAIGHGLEADLASQGLSRYSGMLGEQVASRLVTVMDDATLAGKRGSFRFDDEGTPAGRNVLVREGVLEGYMYDRLTSMRTGAPLTGNGRRESYRFRPVPRMTNTILAPGDTDPSEVLRATHKGLFVKKMGGGQVNTVTGDFVFDVVEGCLIEGGRAAEPVRGATLAGNGPEVLRSIDMVGSDLGFSIGTCGKDSQGAPVSDAMPTVRVPDMVVGGEVGH